MPDLTNIGSRSLKHMSPILDSLFLMGWEVTPAIKPLAEKLFNMLS